MISAKDSARAKVQRAIKSGKLERPAICQGCSEPGPISSDGRATIHAHHHKGYEFPLDVKWLCPTCHCQEDPRPAKESNGRSRLDGEAVSVIRARYAPALTQGGSRYREPNPNSARSLAIEFGVSQATIDRIVRNVNWIDEALK